VHLREEGGRRDLPMLILAGQGVTVSRREEVTVKPYPISLEELSQRLAALKVREMAAVV
jgi:hypothetical protein